MATTLGLILGRLLFPNLSIVTIGLALGVLQGFILQHRIRDPWRWILATTLGWAVGAVILLLTLPNGMDFIAGVVMGLTTGTAQWLILRREVNWAGWWIALNIVGWSTGMGLLPGFLLTGVMAGAITGFAIELLLRYPKPKEPISASDSE
jgi:hypothetical protein